MTAGDQRSTAAHQQRRAELLPGAYNTPCPLCGDLMLLGQELDLDHSDPLAFSPTSVGDRIVHALKADCSAGGNRGLGGKLGSERQRFNPSRAW